MNKEIQPETKDSRIVIFDILCRDADGSVFIVEMQNAPQYYFFDRGLYYLCRMISEQGQKGEDWGYDLCACVRNLFAELQDALFEAPAHRRQLVQRRDRRSDER